MSKNTSPNSTSPGGTSRRRFLTTLSGAAAFQIVPSHVLRAQDGKQTPNEKLNIAFVGAGGRGASNLQGCSGENVYAFADCDQRRCADSVRKYPNAKYFTDWREMLDKIGNDLDCVVVSTPDHNHAIVAMAAMQLGKNVYVEKPLTRTISEARALKAAAQKYGVCTQMGNQGHAAEGARRTNEWIRSGAVGEIREVHCQSSRPIWPQDLLRPAAEEVPPTLDWDVWLGPAPEASYSSQIVPFKWRGFIDYGTGALGDMGAHIFDHPVWALGLGMPETIEVICDRETPGSEKVTHPASCTITYEFAADGDRPPVKLIWFDGKHHMPRPENMDADKNPPKDGCLYYGSEHVFMHGSHGGMPQLVNSAEKADFKEPEKTMERSPGHHAEWIAACKAKDPSMAKSNFDYAAPLTEIMLLGCVAAQVGSGTKLTWNPETLKTGNADADALVHHHYREGWTLGS
ncbi:MAG: Gfo/Idh/MocA family oxidoreductase [Verrucomicrobiae bacterium]|nr:Gfo/Idh/MocA family oxidoreductase [Verrucomicrobiae bacterium]